MAQARLLTVLDTAGQIMSSLELAVYDGRTITKRNGDRKVMTFSSGKHGYFGGGKVMLDGETYQVSCSMVKLGERAASPVTSFTKEQIDRMNEQARANRDERGEHTDEELEAMTRPTQE